MNLANLVAAVAILFVQSCHCETHQHKFIANTNFDNSDRWIDADHGRPCAGDTIEFSSDERISVFVQTDATISEIILPMNGEFIFDDGVTWGVSDDLSTCSDTEHSHVTHFSSVPDDWNNAGNWETKNSFGTLLEKQDLLDIEQVPCMYDESEFPTTNSYTAYISTDIQLKRLEVGNQNLDTTSFAKYRSKEGRYRFVGTGKADIDDRGCQDASGCLCRAQGNLQAALERICLYAECPKPVCENPILALGSCCSICGSILTFNYTGSYTEQQMREFVSGYTSQSEYAGTHTVISKVVSEMLRPQSRFFDKKYSANGGMGTMTNDKPVIQILVTDEKIGSEAGSVATKLAETLYDQLMSAGNSLGVSGIQKQSSGPGIALGMHAGTTALIVVGSIFGFVILLGIVLYATKSALLRRKKSYFAYELNDAETKVYGAFPNVTEVGAGREFESTDDCPNVPKSSTTFVERVGWPQKSALDSDFGISFGNPTFNEEEL